MTVSVRGLPGMLRAGNPLESDVKFCLLYNKDLEGSWGLDNIWMCFLIYIHSLQIYIGFLGRMR